MATTTTSMSSAKQEQYPLCDSAKELLCKLAESFGQRVPEWEHTLRTFAPDEQEMIVSMANEATDNPYVFLLFVPQNDNEARMKAVMEALTPYIKEYEQEQQYKDDYEY